MRYVAPKVGAYAGKGWGSALAHQELIEGGGAVARLKTGGIYQCPVRGRSEGTGRIGKEGDHGERVAPE